MPEMDRMTENDFSGMSREDQMNCVRGASASELNVIMREYDWEQYPEAVLGWISAQKGIALSSAMGAFFNGDPWRFNYLPKRDVGAEFRCTTSLLDSICQRINAGFYLPETDQPCEKSMQKLNLWVENQKRDLRAHRRGRWVIEVEVLEPMLQCQRAAIETELRREPAYRIKENEPVGHRGFSLKKLAGPLAG